MAAKLIVSILTAVAVVVLGACGLLLAMIALNGYSGAQGGRILGSYIVLGLLIVAVSVVVSWLGFGVLAGRLKWSPWAAGPVSFLVTSILACAALIAGFLLSLLVFGRVK